MKTNAIIIAAIVATKNGSGNFRMTLEQEVSQENTIGDLLGKSTSTKRVSWVTVTPENIEKFKFQVGDDFSAKYGKPHTLAIRETVVPRKGDEGKYNMKKNPSTGHVLLHDGKVIYRYTDLAPAGTADVLLSANGSVAISQPASIAADRSEQ